MLPRKLTDADRNAFRNCRHLRLIWTEDESPANLREIGAGPLKTLGAEVIPKSTRLGSMLLWDLRALRELVLPEETGSIGTRRFYGCDAERVTVPSGLREIGEEVFCECRKLRSVTFSEGSRLEKLGRACFLNSDIESVALPPSLKRLEHSTFRGCARLKSVQLPEQLEYVGEACFADCGLAEITVPNSVTETGRSAFAGCRALKKVTFHRGSRLRKLASFCF